MAKHHFNFPSTPIGYTFDAWVNTDERDYYDATVRLRREVSILGIRVATKTVNTTFARAAKNVDMDETLTLLANSLFESTFKL